MKLTIVLTVYNKAPYLRRAFDALLSQEGASEDDYEVIAVDDGSTDDSALIIDEYVRQDAKVRLLSQDNQGLSMARNNGLMAANGEYVWFVDADDTYSSEAVRLICDAARVHPDVIPLYAKTFGFNHVRNMIEKNSKTGREILLGGNWEQCGVFYVFNRSFLLNNELHFMPGIYHEDAEFTPRMLYAARTIKVVPRVVYTVFRDPNSITQIPRAKRAFDYLIVAESLMRFVEIQGETKSKLGKAIYNHIALCINNGFFVMTQNSLEDQHRFNTEFKKKSAFLLPALLNSSQWRYRIEGVLFYFFKGRFISIYSFLQRLK